MAATMTTNEALTGIFTLLSAVVEQQDDTNKSTIRVSDADSTLIQLLQGIVDTNGAEALGTTGEQLEKLSKGIVEVDKVGTKTFESVSTSIELLNKAINLINIKPEINDNLDTIINVLSKFNELSKYTQSLVNFIDSLSLKDPGKSLKEMMVIKSLFMSFNEIMKTDVNKLIKALEALSKDKEIGKSIGNFIKELADGIKDAEGVSAETMKSLNLILNGITQVAQLNITKLAITFNAKSAEKVANAIAGFIVILSKEIQGAENLSLDTVKKINALIDPITNVAKLNMFKLMFTFNPIFAKVVAKAISGFLTILLGELSQAEEISNDAAKSIGTLLEGLSGIGNIKIHKLFFTFNGFMAKRVAHAIAGFISIIANEVKNQEKKTGTDYKIIETILNPLAELGNSKKFKLMNLIKTFNPITAKLIASFFTKLIESLPDDKLTTKKLGAAAAVLEAIGKLNKKGAKAISYLGSHLDQKKGENIANFLTALCSADVNQKSIDATVNLVNAFSQMVMVIVGSIVVLTIIIAITSITDILLALGIVALTVYAAKWLITSLVNDLDKKDIKDVKSIINSISLMLIAMTVSIAILTLIASSVELQDIAIAAGILTLEVILVKWIIKGLTDKEVLESLGQVTSTLYAISVMLIAMSISMKILTNVVADNDFKDIAISFLIVAGFIGLSLLVINNLSSKDKDTDSAIMTLGAMTLMLLAISLMVKFLIIPIGEHAKEALFGSLITVGIVAAMVFIMWLVNQIDIDKIRTGLGIMAGIALLLLITAAITKEIIIPIGEKAGDALAGAGMIALLIIGMGGIAVAIGYLLDKYPSLLEYLVIGAVVLAGISALIWLIGECMDPFIKIAILAGENAEAVAIGSLAIGAIIIATGVIAGLLGTVGTYILPFIAIGAVVLGGIALILGGIGSIVESFINSALLVNSYTPEQLSKMGDNFEALFESLYSAVSAVVPGPMQAIKLALALPATLALNPVMWGIKNIAEYLNEVITSLNSNNISDFHKIVVGNGTDDVNSLIGCMYSIIDAFNEFEDDAVKAAVTISLAMMPILKTISKFIDIVNKVATLSYISGYDKNGNPIFQKLPPSVFADAAEAVSKGFGTFIQMLNDKFKEIDGWSIIAMGWIIRSIDPVMETLSKFVDIVIKVATLNIITGYDKNGKPKYEKVEPEIFGKAAEEISKGFGTFLTVISDKFKALKKIGAWSIEAIGESLKPVMESLSMFVDAVIRVATMQYISKYDKNGNPVYEKIEPSVYKDAAYVVATSFGTFLTTLSDNVKKLNSRSMDVLEDLSEVLMPVMQGISSYVDSIIKLTSAEVLDGYDAEGKAKYRLVKPTEYITAAITIVNSFDTFLTTLTERFKDNGFTRSQRKALETLSETISPIMDGIGKYVDAIIKMGSGTITVTARNSKGQILVNNNGDPITVTKPVDQSVYRQAAAVITNSFTTFIKVLTKNLEPIKNETKKVADSIKDSIGPIMDGVLKFSQALEPFLAIQDDQNNTDKTYELFKPNKIQTISDNVANAFTSFIITVVSSLTSTEMTKYYDDAKRVFPIISKVMENIADSADLLRDIITKLSDKDNNVITTGTTVAEQFFLSLNAFVTGIDFKSDEIDYKLISNNWNQYISPFLTTVLNATELFNQIIQNLTGNEKPYIETVNGFNSALESIVSKSISIYNRIQNIDFNKLIYMMNAYHSVTQELITISNYIMQNDDLTIGIDTFIKNMNILTGTELTNKIVKSGNSISTYQTHLSNLTVQLKQTTTTVKIYITEIDRARAALKALDDQIISKEKARNEALQTFADKVNNIANAIDKLKTSFESLNENKILNQFDNIRKLIDSIKEPSDTNVNVNVNSTTNSTNNTPINRNNNRQNTGNNTQTNTGNNHTTVNNTNSLFGNNIKVEFNLQGWPQLIGHMNISNR